jgi:hypothetical protein
MMGLLKPAKFETAFLKLGLYGLTGSGKTYTSWLIAMGLWHYLKEKLKEKPKPIGFADTEAGSDFILKRFKAETDETGFLVSKTKAFKDLLEIVRDAIKECSMLIVDSITHFWNEILKTYKKEHGITVISPKHWIPLKEIWREYSDLFVASPLHIIMAGRSADIWEEVPDEEGILELHKKGTRMKAEGEMGYETNLLIEMMLDRISSPTGPKDVHRAWVIKDKFDIMNFKTFINPKFENLLPHVELLNIGGKHNAVDLSRTSKEMFEKKESRFDYMRQKEILIEKVQTTIWLIEAGRDDESKKARLKLLEKTFKTISFEELKEMDNERLSAGLKKLEEARKVKK